MTAPQGRGRHRRHWHGHRGRPGSLQRRLFLSFGAAMLGASLLAGAVAFVLRPDDHGPDFHAAEGFVALRFAERWGDDAALAQLADELHGRFGLSVQVHDLAGHERLRRGQDCSRRARPTAIVTDGRTLGHATLCMPRRPHFFRQALALFAAFVVGLWWSSGVIARRLARPLVETAKVASEIGHGALDARVHVHPRAPAEVQHLARAVNEMAARVESTLADQKMLLASVSHEIRTPLGHLRLLVDHAADAGLSETLTRQLEDEVLEIDDLVAQLLAGSKLDTLGPERRTVDAVDAARSALARAGEAESKLVAEGALHVDADPTLLARALANLLRNAREHGGGLVSLRVESDGPAVRFVLRDAGAGLRPEDLARLTQPYARDAADSAGSLGLGLTLVARIALAHGGELRVGEDGELMLYLAGAGAAGGGGGGGVNV
ncbi:MAG: HAMP domain-containing protein [Sandaracinaceae bacterium]|nr:HAMP domain-containing protein [Sandaracinaceae bacterium]